MIITCPECATRYDLEVERFLPNGRSVRCTSCGESWFVPAPEAVEALAPAPRERERGRDRDRDYRDAPRRASAHAERYEEDRYERADRHRSRDDRYDERYEDDRAPGRTSRARDEFDADLRDDRRFGKAERHEEPRRTRRAEFDDEDHRDSRERYDENRDDYRPSRNRAKFRMDEEDRAEDSYEDKDEIAEGREEATFADEAADDLMAPADAMLDDDEDDALFDTPVSEKKAHHDDEHEDRLEAEESDEEEAPKGWRKGKQFFMRDDAEDEDEIEAKSRKDDRKGADDEEKEPVFARRSFRKDEDASARIEEAEELEDDRDYRASRSRRHENEETRGRDTRYYDEVDRDDWRAKREGRDYGDKNARGRDYYDDAPTAEATIVDADWEDIDEDGAGRGFGRRVREERRRATALARLEDVRRFEPEMLDEEFFSTLSVTPRELEKAIRKARRRAEAREKNRMTPWRAFGWSAWVAAVAGAAYAVVAYRDEIVKVAPSAADAYAVVGIETDAFGLKIEDVQHRLAMSTGGPMIEITGALRNSGNEAVVAPLLQAEALGPRGELLSRWTFKPSEPMVIENGLVAFSTRNEAPDGVVEVALSFAPTKSVIADIENQ